MLQRRTVESKSFPCSSSNSPRFPPNTDLAFNYTQVMRSAKAEEGKKGKEKKGVGPTAENPHFPFIILGYPFFSPSSAP